MEQAYPARQSQRRKPRRWVRGIANYGTVILGGAIAARLVMMTIDIIAARLGGSPGGELTLPFYAVLLPAIGWYLRGLSENTKRTKTQKRKEQPR